MIVLTILLPSFIGAPESAYPSSGCSQWPTFSGNPLGMLAGCGTAGAPSTRTPEAGCRLPFFGRENVPLFGFDGFFFLGGFTFFLGGFFGISCYLHAVDSSTP
jgi:hypothetical protein